MRSESSSKQNPHDGRSEMILRFRGWEIKVSGFGWAAFLTEFKIGTLLNKAAIWKITKHPAL